MKIYTKTGDAGETGLFAGPRVRKNHVRIEAYGEVDELNAVLGQVLISQPSPATTELISKVQHELFSVGAVLATPDPEKHGTNLVKQAQITALEEAIDQSETSLQPLTQFILPGGSPAAATLHLARCVCRRAERRVVALAGIEPSEPVNSVVIYLNRLSVLLFVLARVENAASGAGDIPWQKP